MRSLITLLSLSSLIATAHAETPPAAPAPVDPYAPTQAEEPAPPQPPAQEQPPAKEDAAEEDSAKEAATNAPEDKDASAPEAAPPEPANEPPVRVVSAKVKGLAGLDVDALPEKCKPLAKRAKSTKVLVSMPIRVSLANCLAEARMTGIVLVDSQDSVLALEAATEDSFGLLSEAYTQGDLPTRIMARHAEGELYNGMLVRMMGTIPPAGTGEAALALHETRKQLLDTFLAPWRQKAHLAFNYVVEMGRANPKLVASNPVVKTAVRTSQQRMSATGATATASR